jgi:hypothetical protein
MNDQLILYWERAIRERSLLDRNTKYLKIWARWIITHLSLCPQTPAWCLLPNDDSYDLQLDKEFRDVGKSVQHSAQLQRHFNHLTRQFNRYPLMADHEFGGIVGRVPVRVHHKRDQVTLVADVARDQLRRPLDPNLIPYDLAICRKYKIRMSVCIPAKLYQILRQRVRSAQLLPAYIDAHILFLVALYRLLEGKGLQWSTPPPVTQTLQSQLNCQTELFASPLNNTYPYYYSLFPTERMFGSLGNFFRQQPTLLEGSYQVNPPFIDAVFTKTTYQLLAWLTRAQQHNRELTFVYIMPNWDNFLTRDLLLYSRFCVSRIELRPMQHYYYQTATDSYIQARFGTLVLILTTNPALINPRLEAAIIKGFQSPEPRSRR